MKNHPEEQERDRRGTAERLLLTEKLYAEICFAGIPHYDWKNIGAAVKSGRVKKPAFAYKRIGAY